jgi:hypothetical protein
MALVTRVVDGYVRVDGKDAEDIGSDEFIHENRPFERVLLENQDTLIPEVHDFRWGGECRVEVDLHAMLQPKTPPPVEEQIIHVWGQCRFYEGASEDTNEREDLRDFAFDVPKTRPGSPPIRFEVPLKNHALIGADDWANVTFQIKNRVAELD